MVDPYAAAKRSAGFAAADLVESGSRLGLGTGSTFVHVLDRLHERIQQEGLEVIGVPTSEATASRARELGIPLWQGIETTRTPPPSTLAALMACSTSDPVAITIASRSPSSLLIT